MPVLFEFRRYRLPFLRPARTAHGLWAEREGLLIRIERADGSLGYGEAAPIPWFGTETTDEAEAAARELGSRIELDYLGRIPPKLACLRHALASALAPIRTEPPKHPTLGVAALLPAGLDALVSAEIKGEAGFRIFKWKVGVQEADKELLRQVLGQMGKIGSNLNQIARSANIDPGERIELSASIAVLRAIAPLLMEALGRPIVKGEAA